MVQNRLLEVHVQAVTSDETALLECVNGHRATVCHLATSSFGTALRAEHTLQEVVVLHLGVQVKLADDKVLVLLRWPPCPRDGF